MRPPKPPEPDERPDRDGQPAYDAPAPDRVEKSDAQWQRELDGVAYFILRTAGTERAFTGEHWDTRTPGLYRCAGCKTPLFVSEDKFDSGCGWPSFRRPVAASHVDNRIDRSHGMVRTEVTCHACGGHLGHVFPDGPPPTGLRYCINSGAIELVADAEPHDGVLP